MTQLTVDEDIARGFPDGTVDRSSYSDIEDALDRIEAPSRDGYRWLTLPQRIEAFSNDVDARIEEAREEERQEAAMLWPAWADRLLKILRAYGVPCDDEEGVDLPEELREWLSDYKAEIRQAAEQLPRKGDGA